jgi:ribosome-binding protein aMBF1 (putative translation factor)
MTILKNRHKFRGGRHKEVVKEVGKRFEAFRYYMGKTLEELAAEMDCSPSILKRIEKGDMEAIFTHGGELVEQYNLDLTWLVCGTKKMLIDHRGPFY